MTTAISLDLGDRIGVLTIDREERRNALDNDAIDAFLAALEKVHRSSIVALVITGAGDRAFCAGSDIKALAAYSYDQAVYHTHLFQKLTESIDELPCATIAAIEGACLGGGLEIALACDWRVASTQSRFGFPEITIGLLPTGGGTVRAPRAIGLARTREMMLFGEPVPAPRALDIGLISELAEPGAVRQAARERADRLAESTSREAVMLLKGTLVTGAGAAPRIGQMMAYLSDVALLRSGQFATGAGDKRDKPQK